MQESAIRAAVEAVESAERDLRNALDERNAVFAAARASGMTWRAIALASGMTEHGIRKALGYRREPPVPA
jgi:hypothetical protein